MMLEGLRVIDLGSFITAPLAAMMLGDLGADVIKVERPEGDPFRRGHGTDYGPTFLAFNRNKRSLTIDTTKPEGRESLSKLIDTADILIDNCRAPTLQKLALDPGALRARNPGLIHCSITGFGGTGPYCDRPAFDSVGQAMSGIMSLLVDPENPRAFGPTISDNVTAMYAAYGIMGALIERGRTSKGKRIEVNMLECSMAFIQDIYVNLMRTDVVSGRYTRAARSQCFVFGCADGASLSIHLSTGDKFWRLFAEAIGAADLVDDKRFHTHQARVANYQELTGLLSEYIVKRPRAEWIDRFSRADVPFAPLHTVADALQDPQVEALGSIIKMRHAVEGEVLAIACPILADGSRPREDMHAPPKLGEHTEALLAELRLESDAT